MSPEDLAYQGYSTMGGGWGLSLRLGDLDAEQRQVVRDLIVDYHQLRELIPGARVYHLQPPLAVAVGAANGPAVQDWFVLQYVHPEIERGAILAVRNGGGAEQVTLKLRGLTPESPYQVEWSAGSASGDPHAAHVADERGDTLMQDGVPITLPPYSGGVLWVTPTA